MARINAANLSLQHHDFHFREPETNRPLVQTIYAGRQIQIYKEESPEILAAIVAQHEKYGIVAAKSLKRATESVGLCYQFDKPIVIATILEGMLENKRRLEESGPKMIKTAAIAAGCSVREHLYSEGLKQVENYSIEIEETSPTELRGADAESFEKSRFHRLFGVDLEN